MAVALIVDGNKASRNKLSRFLQRRGHAVEVASDGPTAIRVAAALKPEIIFLDMSLPEVDGHPVAQHLKADPKTKTIPLVGLIPEALAANPPGAESGCDDFETAPFDPTRALVKMEILLSQQTSASRAPRPS